MTSSSDTDPTTSPPRGHRSRPRFLTTNGLNALAIEKKGSLCSAIDAPQSDVRRTPMSVKAHHLAAKTLPKVHLPIGDLDRDALRTNCNATIDSATVIYENTKSSKSPAREAMGSLGTHPRRECMWSSWSAWIIGKFLIQSEEKGMVFRPTQTLDITTERRVSRSGCTSRIMRAVGQARQGRGLGIVSSAAGECKAYAQHVSER